MQLSIWTNQIACSILIMFDFIRNRGSTPIFREAHGNLLIVVDFVFCYIEVIHIGITFNKYPIMRTV